MAIHTPGKRWGKRLERSKVFGKHMGGHKATNADLLVTPLVDMFVIIVLFLMANFSATGEVLSMRKDVTLPSASHVQEIVEAEYVVVTQDEKLGHGDGYVILSGETVGTISQLSKDEQMLEFPQLVEKLKQKREAWENVHKSAGDTTPFPGDLNIQAHVDVPFKVVKRVMASASLAGFGNQNYAVLSVPTGKAEGGETQAAVVP